MRLVRHVELDVRSGMEYSLALDAAPRAAPRILGIIGFGADIHLPDAMPRSKQGRAREQELTVKGRDGYV
jgi:hypothetical protein